MKQLLAISNLAVSYGHIEAVKGIDLTLNEGEITALVGANGAGKSTSLLAISGLLKPTRGSIMFDGMDLAKMRPHQIVKSGIVQVAEGRAILTTLTIAENLALGSYARQDKSGVATDLEWVYSLFPVLKERAAGLAGNLSGGEQQMLAIGRALMSNPRLLLLDEPSLGLAPLVVHTIFEAIDEIRGKGTTILLVEQNAHAALGHSDRAYVLETGRIVMEGPSKELAADPRIKEAYLGE